MLRRASVHAVRRSQRPTSPLCAGRLRNETSDRRGGSRGDIASAYQRMILDKLADKPGRRFSQELVRPTTSADAAPISSCCPRDVAHGLLITCRLEQSPNISSNRL